MQELYDKAHAAGQAAAEACTPTPMVVVNHQSGKRYHVPGGVCGFATINIRPGNCRFANWLKKNDIGRKAYYGGVDISVFDYGQSMELKGAYAGAFAAVIREEGITCYSNTRMD